MEGKKLKLGHFFSFGCWCNVCIWESTHKIMMIIFPAVATALSTKVWRNFRGHLNLFSFHFFSYHSRLLVYYAYLIRCDFFKHKERFCWASQYIQRLWFLLTFLCVCVNDRLKSLVITFFSWFFFSHNSYFFSFSFFTVNLIFFFVIRHVWMECCIEV